MITIKASSTDTELQGILKLQQQNLSSSLSAVEKENQGFVTVVHTLDDLQKMHTYEPNLIAEADGKVIAYILAMTANSKDNLPILLPMFESFNHIEYLGKPIAAYNYLVVGQVCVAKNYRGAGLFDKCYLAYKKYFELKYDFAITEVASINLRSMAAHLRIGFKEIYKTKDPNGLAWSVVLWDWKN